MKIKCVFDKNIVNVKCFLLLLRQNTLTV